MLCIDDDDSAYRVPLRSLVALAVVGVVRVRCALTRAAAPRPLRHGSQRVPVHLAAPVADVGLRVGVVARDAEEATLALGAVGGRIQVIFSKGVTPAEPSQPAQSATRAAAVHA